MKTMKDQVTSIEQSKRLIDLGVPAGKASMVYRKRYILVDVCAARYFYCCGNLDVLQRI